MARPKKEQGDQLRAYDENGNVRPADARYLSPAQVKAQKAYVEEAQGSNPELFPADGETDLSPTPEPKAEPEKDKKD